ncbi:MAG: NAD(P)-dependent oxidoreductase [Candidatus Bathyarchaeota archaeon]|nr:MAG: NAD(P)-dependent oxidoreductase [Candidatus Bathyarchaeota archaeon]
MGLVSITKQIVGVYLNILVTGGAGYIGSVMSRILLEKGYNVTVLDRLFFGTDSLKEVADQITIVKDDIRFFDPKLLENIDAVFDLAALSNDPCGELDQQKTLEINYKGRVRVANLAKKYNIKKYVFASTCSVYGFQDEIINEESDLNPLTTYAKASVLAEKEIIPLFDKNFSPTVLRQATVYGFSRRMRFDLAINGMTLGYYKNGKIPIMRDGKQWRPFVNIKDTSCAFIKVLETEPELVSGQIFNVGSNDQNIQIFDLAKLVAEACDLPFNYEWYGDCDTRSYRVSFNKIKDALNFKPETTIKQGAKNVFNALNSGTLNPDDPRMITVKWYKHLLEMQEFLKSTEIDGVLL